MIFEFELCYFYFIYLCRLEFMNSKLFSFVEYFIFLIVRLDEYSFGLVIVKS